MADYGVTNQGFVIKDLSAIKSELQTAFTDIWGANLDVSDNSVAGQTIGNLALKFSNLWELAEAVYNAFSPDSATGVSLDRVLAIVNVIRTKSTKTSVYVALYGDEGTVVTADHEVSDTNGYLFKLAADVTITHSNAVDVSIGLSDDPVSGATYSITVNSKVYSYKSIDGDTKLSIVTALQNLVNAGETVVQASVTSSTSVVRIYASDGYTAFAVALTSNLEYTILGSPGQYTCETSGAISVSIGTVTNIVDSITGLDSVNNLIAGETGNATETDIEARERRRTALYGYGYATDDAIYARVLQEVDNVSYVKVVSNRTDSADSEDRPAHSTEVIVLGGTDSLIAAKLWAIWPAGTQFYGTTSVTVLDSNGDSQAVKFSRPTNVYIWVKIILTLSSEEDFPTDGTTEIANNIITWATENLTVGTDILYQKLFNCIYAVNGVESAELTIGSSLVSGTEPTSYAAANIAIGSAQAAVFDLTQISVTTV
jgi:uncharacterized phage protein gp47/JayE